MTIQARDFVRVGDTDFALINELRLVRHGRIFAVSDAEARRQCNVCFTTACWRNFVARWEIRESELFLCSLEGKYNLAGTEPLHASWISATLHIQECQIVEGFWDDRYNGGLPHEYQIEVEAGRVLA